MRAKKSLGQNFLSSEKIIHEILDAAELSGEDIVLEVGPGKGDLTHYLLTEAGKVIAVEKDSRLIPILKEKFSKEIAENRLDLIEKDILDFDLSLLGFYDLGYKLIANIPYYITGQIFRKFLTADKKPKRIVLMVQKEVAERIVARDGKESLLSLSIKAYGTPKIIMTVPKTYFKPKPKVDSAVLLVDKISNDFFKNLGKVAEHNFFDLIKQGFSSKRKILLGNLKKFNWQDGKTTKQVFEICGIDEKSRAENLKMGDWHCLLSKSVDK